MLRLNECFAIKRKRENKVRAAFFTICFVAAVFLLSTPYAYAQLVPDQTNDVSTLGVSFGSDGAMLSQGFTPTLSTVDAIDLRLRLGGSFPSIGYDTTIYLRSGAPLGPILGSATTHVVDEGGGLNGQLVRFEFSPPVCVSPGQTYFIQWIAPDPSILTWMGDQNNPYLGGTSYTGLLESLTDDMCFITYAYAGFPLIGRTVWADLEFVRFIFNDSVHGGWLVSALTRYGSNGSNYLVFSNSSAVNSFQADVKVTAYQNNGSYPHASLLGRVYKGVYQGITGDIIAVVGIGHDGTDLQGFWSISRCKTANCNLPSELDQICSGSFDSDLGVPSLNTTYPVAFSWDGASSFTFSINGHSRTVNSTNNCGVNFPLNVGPPDVTTKGIGTRISNITNSGEGGFISATFDNVHVNGSLRDNFDSSNMIDPTKWANWEFVRAVSGCELVSALTQRGVNGSNNISFLNSQTVSEFLADLKVVEFQNNGARPQGRLYAAFYNDGTGTTTTGDLTGDIIASVGILDNGQGSGPQAFYAVSRCTAPNCNLPSEYQILYSGIFKNVGLNETHRFSLSWNGLNIILVCDGSPILYNPTSFAPVVGPPKGRKGIGTRVSEISNTNEWAYVSAQFANITTFVDTDGDGIPDFQDNCPSVSNPPVASWVDINGTFHNDNSQPDFDLDHVGDACDLCPKVVNDGGPCPSSTGTGTDYTTGSLITVTITYNGPPTYLVPPDCNNVVLKTDKPVKQNCRRIPPYKLTVLEGDKPGYGRPGGDWGSVNAGYSRTIICNLLEIFNEEDLKAQSPVQITPMYTFFETDRGLDPAGNCTGQAQGEICVDTTKYDLFQGTIPAQPVSVVTTNLQPPKSVSIDIKPGSPLPKTINLGSSGNIPVAILSTADFDATGVNPYTVNMGAASVRVVGKKGTLQESISDVNRDGRLDMIVHFDTQALGFTEGAVEICLTGETTGEIAFMGCNPVTIVP